MNTIMLTVRIYNNLQFMKKYVSYFMLIAIVSVFVSCASSKSTTTVLSGTDISKYKYVVFGTGDEGDAELADMLMMVQNEISEKLQVVSVEKAKTLIAFMGVKTKCTKEEQRQKDRYPVYIRRLAARHPRTHRETKCYFGDTFVLHLNQI